MSTGRSSRSRRGAVLVAAAVLCALLVGCSPERPYERLSASEEASVDARAAADSFVQVLDGLERQVAVARQPAGSARSTVTEVASEVALGSQARAFFEAHATQVERDTRTAGLSTAGVEVVEVAEAQDRDGPVALVTVDTVRTPEDAPATTTRTSYALTWDTHGSSTLPPDEQTTDEQTTDEQTTDEPTSDAATPSSATPSSATSDAATSGSATPETGPAGLRLVEVRALHDDDGHAAVVDPSAGSSVLGVASSYLSTLQSGTDREVDTYEGGVRSSADLRDAMRSRLGSSGRSTPVEVPCGRHGAVQLVYVVLDADVPPLRLEVDVSGDDPVVNAYL